MENRNIGFSRVGVVLLGTYIFFMPWAIDWEMALDMNYQKFTNHIFLSASYTIGFLILEGWLLSKREFLFTGHLVE